ncbi:hypothetical protein CR513_48211, partial [Mucuna pruriens]
MDWIDLVLDQRDCIWRSVTLGMPNIPSRPSYDGYLTYGQGYNDTCSCDVFLKVLSPSCLGAWWLWGLCGPGGMKMSGAHSPFFGALFINCGSNGLERGVRNGHLRYNCRPSREPLAFQVTFQIKGGPHSRILALLGLILTLDWPKNDHVLNSILENFGVSPSSRNRASCILCKERKLQLQELEELRLEAYENSKVYKEKLKCFHDNMILTMEFKVGHKVLLFNSHLKLIAVEIRNEATDKIFKVNGHQLKLFHECPTMMDGDVEDLSLAPYKGFIWILLRLFGN